METMKISNFPEEEQNIDIANFKKTWIFENAINWIIWTTEICRILSTQSSFYGNEFDKSVEVSLSHNVKIGF